MVVHLAAIPAPRTATGERTFEMNTLRPTTSSARPPCRRARVVWASSETVLGLPSAGAAAFRRPIDETLSSPGPESSRTPLIPS